MGKVSAGAALWGWLFLLILVPAGCRQNPSASSSAGPILRVCLMQNVDSVQVRSSAPVVAKSSNESDSRKLNFPSGADVPVAMAAEGWQIGNVVMGGGELLIKPAREGAVSVNGKPYRGEYRLVPAAEGKFDVVNDVPMEGYLKGVLPGELPRSWHPEAYEAQAITARTYALFEMKTRSAGKHFDVFDDTRSQVYGGMSVETAKSREGVDDTAGIVLAYAAPGNAPKIFKAYFSSCCGGVGQSVTDAFNEEGTPVMTEQSVGGLCNASPKYNWPPVVLSKAELTRRVKTWGARRNRPEKDMAMIARLDVSHINQYGRPVRFIITDTRGNRFSLSGEETRWACNADANGGPILLSSFFKPVNEDDAVRFTDGHGFGHGVGLCQWCTEARAEQGMRHEDIVRLAFPRSILVAAY
ncbi:SpoIID/LytB domain-containing protein [soil metagenome]